MSSNLPNIEDDYDIKKSKINFTFIKFFKYISLVKILIMKQLY